MEAGEDAKTEENTCVQSILSQRQCSLRSTIHSLVQITSEVECRGSSIYTFALFRCLETRTVVPEAFLKQGFIYSCFAAALNADRPPYAPDPICERFKQEAMLHIPPGGFDSMYMVQTINTIARRYLTNIRNSFVQYLYVRQLRAVRPYQPGTVQIYQSQHRRLWQITSSGRYVVNHPVPNPMMLSTKTVHMVWKYLWPT